MQNEQDRFLRKVSYNPVTHCWDWVGSKYRYGYGHFRRKIHGKWVMYKAHRYAYEYYRGPIPPNKMVLHSCDNPSCVNPEHLHYGSAQDNINDMISRGRKRLGRNPKHKHLDMNIAQQIRDAYKMNPEIKQTQIADNFKVSTAQVSRIINNLIWKGN